jgi:hypothetical protein
MECMGLQELQRGGIKVLASSSSVTKFRCNRTDAVGKPINYSMLELKR